MALSEASRCLQCGLICYKRTAGVLENAAGPFSNIEGSTASVVAAAVFFGISFVMIRYQGNRMAENQHYRPKVIRIKSRPSLSR